MVLLGDNVGGPRLVELALCLGRGEHPMATRARRSPQSVGREVDDEYPYYSPRVECAYKVDAILHTSSTIWLSGYKSMRRGRAERIAACYQAGHPVEVWYDPKKPARPTLKPGGAGWLLAGLVAVSVVRPLLAAAFTEEGRRILAEIGIHVE